MLLKSTTIATLLPLVLSSLERLRLYRGAASIFLTRLVQLGMGLASTYLLERSMVISMIYGLAIFALTFLAIPWLLPFLLGDNHADAVPYAQALTCSVAIGNQANMRFRFIRSSIDELGFRDLTLFSSAICLAAFVALIPPFGIIGAAVAIFIYRLALVGIVRIVIKWHYAAV